MRKIILAFLMALLPWSAFADSQGSATGGTMGTQSTLSGCIYQSATPTLSAGQQTGIRCDVNGNLLTTGGGGGGGGNVNLTGINGVTPSVGNGTTDTGTLRATISSDSTGSLTVKQPTASALNATVVGTGTLAVQNTAATPAGTNVIGHVITDTTSTTAATQATAANLNATVVGTGTFATQSAQSGTWNITNVSGAVSLPTGASTSALQTTGNTSLGTIATNSGTQATAANQTTGNSSLSTIATNTGTIATNTTNAATPTMQPCAAAGCAVAPTVSAVSATSVVGKASANAIVFDFYCYAGATAGNCILYNATAAPGSGAITSTLVMQCVPVAANGYASVTNPMTPDLLSAGAVLLFSSAAGSSNCNTYTPSSTAYLRIKAK